MPVVTFRDHDDEYAAWVADQPNGFVLNVQRGLNPSDARIHSASCSHLARAIAEWAAGGRGLTSSYVKVCSRLAEDLDEWIARELATSVRQCPTCSGPASSHVHAWREDMSAQQVPVDRPYVVTASSREVQMHGPRYLPFERLTSVQLEARARLRGALAGLTPGAGEVLQASYSGPKPPNSDVENLVLYCIDAGGTSLARATCVGVRFELDSTGVTHGPCQYHYRVLPPSAPLATWQRGERLARFDDVQLGAFPTSHRLARTWLAVHTAQAEVRSRTRFPEEAFGVFLNIQVPGAPTGVRPELVKSLIDGVVSAFQSHRNESTLGDVAARIAIQLGEPPQRVEGLLRRQDRAVLGHRQSLVHHRAAGVQWSPDDHMCVVGQLLRRPGERWKLSGEIYALQPVHPS